jgi:hypothetical protein
MSVLGKRAQETVNNRLPRVYAYAGWMFREHKMMAQENLTIRAC